MKPLWLIALLISGAVHAQTFTYVDIPGTFCTNALISFDLTTSDQVSLDVYDHTGIRVMAFMESKTLAAGHYEVTLPGEGLASDTYTIRYSDTRTLVVRQVLKACTTGIADEQASASIAAFPNPAQDMITIPIKGTKQIVFANLSGRICKSLVTEEKSISISDLAAGNYILSIFDHSGQRLTSELVTKD